MSTPITEGSRSRSVFRPLDRDAPADRGERVGVFADADAQPVRAARHLLA